VRVASAAATGIELAGESPGLVGEQWKGRDHYVTMFGQAYMVTALQEVSMLAAIGNGGTRPRPHLAGLIVDRLRERRGVDATARPDKARRILGEELWGVVAATAPAPRSAEELRTLIERIHEL